MLTKAITLPFCYELFSSFIYFAFIPQSYQAVSSLVACVNYTLFEKEDFDSTVAFDLFRRLHAPGGSERASSIPVQLKLELSLSSKLELSKIVSICVLLGTTVKQCRSN